MGVAIHFLLWMFSAQTIEKICDNFFLAEPSVTTGHFYCIFPFKYLNDFHIDFLWFCIMHICTRWTFFLRSNEKYSWWWLFDYVIVQMCFGRCSLSLADPNRRNSIHCNFNYKKVKLLQVPIFNAFRVMVV